MIQNTMTIEEMLPPILEIMEGFGYPKYVVWGRRYDDFRVLLRFFQKSGNTIFTLEKNNDFRNYVEARYKNGEISRSYRGTLRRAARLLDEYHEKGTISWHVEKRGSKYPLCKEFQKLHDSFLASREFKSTAKQDFSWAIRRYLFYFQEKGICSLESVTVQDVQKFIIHISQTMKTASLKNLVCYLRQFHLFLLEKGIPAPDCVELLSMKIKRDMPIYDYVHDDELALIFEQIDSASAIGKRDKAMIMLGASTGMRACDIVKLKLTDIDWRKGEIRIQQSKTGNPITLPLLPETGEAIRDYILNARPDSESSEVFLRAAAPFHAIASGVTVEYAFDKYSQMAGISRVPFDGKGFHGLRRRLGRNMVVTGTPITTVAQILGHESLESTKQYLALDTQNLKECALDFQGIPVERRALQ